MNTLKSSFLSNRVLFVALILSSFAFVTPALAQTTNAASPLGINLNGVNYYTSEQPLLNIFKTGGWITQTSSTWDTNEETKLALDANGWPTSVTVGSGGQTVTYNQVSALLVRDLGAPYYPSGRYIVLYDGQGTISYRFDAVKNTALSAPGRDVLDVTPGSGGILITISATDPSHTGNYIRNIRLIKAENEALLNSGEMFNPDFISRISQFRALRFMDWMQTNGSTEGTSWGSRATPNSAFWSAAPLNNDVTTHSVPVEVTVALANKVGADPWFNMPHLANDNYITQFATLVHQQLASGRKVYVEYSNETWNYIFGQTSWIQSQGLALWPSALPFDANRSYYGMRTAQMCDIWKNVWGADASRVVCVLAAQAANTYTATQSLACPLWTAGTPCSNHGFNAIAIAPYFGYDVPSTWTSDPDGGLGKLFTEINQGGLAPGGYAGGMIKEAIDWVTAYKTVATQKSLDLIAYESGQSLVDYANNAALTNLYITANRDARMGAATASYLQQWKAAGGNLLTYFSDISAFSKYGSWGALENVMLTNSPKYDALTNFITANPCWWSGCSSGGPPPPPPPDTTAPSTPTNLSASAVSSSQINLTWTASTDNVAVTGYQVFRNGTQVATPSTNSYNDTGLTAATAYSYTVKATDAAGNVSSASAIQGAQPTGPLTLTALTANKSAPQAPGTTITFTATATGGTPPYQYKWWVYNGTWQIAQTWAASNTFAWTPGTANSGYLVGVWVKSAGNPADTFDDSAVLAFPIQGH